MGKIILFGGQKGGVGKSTYATNMSAILAINGYSVILVDSDKQESSYGWAETRGENENLATVDVAKLVLRNNDKSKILVNQLKSFSEKYDFVIVDAGGRDSMELRAAISVCNKFFIPLKASQPDFDTIPKMIQMVDDLEIINPDIQFKILMSMISPNPVVKENLEFKEGIKELEELLDIKIPLLNEEINDRKTYRDVFKEGMSVLEINKPNAKAKKEMNALLKEVLK
ncbi:MAG: ParA family protein [Desulfobacterales bacterium]|nr:ParA family protein [Desulfobacterales bacterium]